MRVFLKRIVVFLLTLEARCVLARYKPKIVAITGSVGKTSTKDAVYTVLSGAYHARKSDKSFNSELGVPLTILGLPNAWSDMFGWLENLVEGLHVLMARTNYPEWLVLEVGADRPGDIRALRWLHPHIVVYTRFPDVPVHVEYFESPEQVIAEKRELGKALRPTGTLIVNADDAAMTHVSVGENQRILSYGFRENATVRGIDAHTYYDERGPAGVACRVLFQDGHDEVRLPGTVGDHHVYPLLAALAVGVSEGMAYPRAVEALKHHAPPPGRMRILAGKNGSTIIDDTYNASPVAVEAGLEALAGLRVPGRKIVVLGDMMELGDFSVTQHKNIGAAVTNVANTFLAVGIRMRNAADAAREKKGMCERVESVQDAAEALAYLRDYVVAGDVVFVKGSQSMRMERVVAGLLADPSKAPELLVRQDAEWQKR